MSSALVAATPATSLPGHAGALRAIFWGGLICGVLDITAACISAGFASGARPVRVFQSVAGGLLGRAALEGGAVTAAFGLFLHFCVAFGWTLVFYALSRRSPVLTRHAALAGPVYGLVVFAGMNYVTLPLLSWLRSFYLHTPVVWVGSMGWTQAVIHMFCVGLPIALAVRRWAP